jgi:hypothetical protein
MLLKTWSVNLKRNIVRTIMKIIQTNINKNSKRFCLQKQSQNQGNGIGPQKVKNGTYNRLKKHLLQMKEPVFVLSAVKSIKQYQYVRQDIAAQNVKTDTIQEKTGILKNGMRTEYVNVAEKPFQLISGPIQNIVVGPVRRKRVYDLSIEQDHEYFANDILVHNCSDGSDYLVCQLFTRYFDKFM